MRTLRAASPRDGWFVRYVPRSARAAAKARILNSGGTADYDDGFRSRVVLQIFRKRCPSRCLLQCMTVQASAGFYPGRTFRRPPCLGCPVSVSSSSAAGNRSRAGLARRCRTEHPPSQSIGGIPHRSPAGARLRMPAPTPCAGLRSVAAGWAAPPQATPARSGRPPALIFPDSEGRDRTGPHLALARPAPGTIAACVRGLASFNSVSIE
ncbi:hypothetical protein C8Q79DRAFT_450656 [Trametes meyenii]|nr:hypothetical protein C8Q79DRAFT_450656 [Trametes meyenii]